MTGRCNFRLDNDQVCNSTHYLHGIIFLNPESPGTIERIDLCKFHYGILTDNHTQTVRELQMRLKNTIQENENRRKLARSLDTYYNDIPMRKIITDTRALLQLTQMQCKNYLCNADLSSVDRYSKVYTVITIKPSNKLHYKFYFCSLRCFNSFKARCGLPVPILRGQLSL